MTAWSQETVPLKVGVVGLVHTHVHWILGREDVGDIEIVGVAEPNEDLARRYAKQHGFSMDIVFPTIDEMLKETQPQAVTAFNTILGHLEVVQKCAPKGIHVMVEKPMAISLEHAREMARLAEIYGIHLLTNYETTWYPTTTKVLEMNDSGEFGVVRKIVVNDGHQGPVEIGINEEFLEWLSDPAYNGAGALTDFGCYGANLITALYGGIRPSSITAVTQQLKPEKYPDVDDQATIILNYPDGQGVIQASWAWTYSRKDMEVYGERSYIKTKNANTMYVRASENLPEKEIQLPPLSSPQHDPFAYLKAVVDGDITPYGDLSSLSNNIIVMEILDAAMRSAREEKTIYLK